MSFICSKCKFRCNMKYLYNVKDCGFFKGKIDLTELLLQDHIKIIKDGLNDR